jgi:hypothetical protein
VEKYFDASAKTFYVSGQLVGLIEKENTFLVIKENGDTCDKHSLDDMTYAGAAYTSPGYSCATFSNY